MLGATTQVLFLTILPTEPVTKKRGRNTSLSAGLGSFSNLPHIFLTQVSAYNLTVTGTASGGNNDGPVSLSGKVIGNLATALMNLSEQLTLRRRFKPHWRSALGVIVLHMIDPVADRVTAHPRGIVGLQEF